MENHENSNPSRYLKTSAHWNIIESEYIGIFIAGLVLIILCAWFSEGYHSADEHFQIFEFVNYKLGKSQASELPWEFHAQLRATVLPSIAVLLGNIMDFFGSYNPFILAFLLRLFTGIVSWYVYCKFCLLLLPKFTSEKGKQLFILSCLFLWFIPYLCVRYTPENISGLLVLSGMYSILRVRSIDNLPLNPTSRGLTAGSSELTKNTHSLSIYLLSGIFLGMGFFIRPQTSAAIAGFVFWLMVIDKTPLKHLAILILSMLIPIVFLMCVDTWFYGEWTFTPYNYFHANIVQHKADAFGVKPWWYYFYQLLAKSIPPLSILLFTMFAVGVYKNWRDPFVFTILPFIFLHLLIGHKELRFLFPVVYLYIYVFSLGFDHLFSNISCVNVHKWYSKLLIFSIPLLLFRSLLPSGGGIEHYRYLYDKISSKNTIFFYSNDELPFNFYNKQFIKKIFIADSKQLETYLLTKKPEQAFLISNKSVDVKMDNYEIKAVYSPTLFFIFPKPTIYSFHRLVT